MQRLSSMMPRYCEICSLHCWPSNNLQAIYSQSLEKSLTSMTRVRFTMCSLKALTFLFVVAYKIMGHHTHMRTWSTSLFSRSSCLQYRKAHTTFCTAAKTKTRQNRPRKRLGNAIQRTKSAQGPRLRPLTIREVVHSHLPCCRSAHAAHRRKCPV